MSAYEIIKTARHRLEAQPELWTQKAFAYAKRNDEEYNCEPDDPSAICFCVAGLLFNTGVTVFKEPLVYDEELYTILFKEEKLQAEIFDTLESLVPHRSIGNVTPYSHVADWNDAPERTVDEVIDLLKKAEEKLRGTD